MRVPVPKPARPLITMWIFAGLLLSAVATVPAAAATEAPSASSPAGQGCGKKLLAQSAEAPVLAHYYIWFQASSWNRAKSDYPDAGRYSSSQRSIMEEQVAEAQAAGIDGFIVSWKSSTTLNSRLATLRTVAADHDFKLAITYEAQDFNRTPLPVAEVERDLTELADTYADDPVFHVLGSRPLVALSGTWHYTIDELRAITERVSRRLSVLATERNVGGYERVASAVDGDLYYWSSGDPNNPAYREKLQAMEKTTRAHCGVWVAPVSPGFDGRELGSTRVIDRRDGATLRSSWEAAMATVPDAIGVISWNQFSEKTHIEPSTAYGNHYLQTLGKLTGAPPLPTMEPRSNGPLGAGSPARAALPVAAAVALVLLVSLLGLRRHLRGDRR